MAIGKVCLLLSLLIIQPLFSLAQVYTSVQSGNWSDPCTWDPACASGTPGSADDAVIASGHSVALTANTTIDDVTINSSATLLSGGKILTVDGNLLLNGTFDAKRTLTLNGSGSTIDGFGTVTNMGGVTISSGNKTVLSNANLTISNGDFIVDAGLTVSNYGTITLAKKLVGGDAASTWVNESGSTLNAGNVVLATGILTASAVGNTVNYNQAGAQIVILPSSTYYNLNIAGNNTKTLRGSINVLGNLTITSTLDVTATNYDINIGGNWNNSGLFLEQLATVTFDGSDAQSITNTLGEIFHNLTIDKSGGTLTLNNSVTVSGINPGTFTMTRGNIDATAATLTLGDACGNEGALTYTAGAIVGKFERWINTVSQPYLFPVGTATDYRPATITTVALSPCGSLIGEFIESDPGGNGLPIRDGFAPPDSVRNTFVEGYWTLTPNGLGSTDYNLELEGNGFTSFAMNAETRLLVRPNAGSNWDSVGTHIGVAGDIVKRNTITVLPAHYAFGDSSNCTGPSTGLISGPDSVCTGDGGIGYSVPNTLGSTYTWTITGGSIASGQGLNGITVNWDGTGMVGNVQVVENNGCTNGAPVDAAVNIHTLPTSSISGRAAVGDSTTGESYSVTAMVGYTYTWSITGGTIASGQGTDSITVDWGAPGAGNVRCVGSTGCGSAPPVDLAISIYVSIISINSTDWTLASTWDCGCIPAKTDNVVIDSGYTVTLTGNTEANNFTINTGGTLTGGGNRMTVTGDFKVDGAYNAANDVKLKGTSVVTLSGTGIISITGGKAISVEGGDVLIASSANLTVSSGDLKFNKAGVSVTNNGSISFDFNIVDGMGTVSWTNAANSTLNIGGNLDPASSGTFTASAAGNTVNFNGSGIQTVKCPTSGQYYNLLISNANTKTLECNLNVDGNLTISGTAQLDVSSYNIALAGNWNNSSTNADPFFERSQTVTFDGSGAQSITNTGGETFYNLTLNKSGNTLTVNDNVTASNTLTMSGGNIDAGTDTITLGSGAGDGTLSRAAGMITGRFQRYLSSAGAKLFPIGVSTDYRPASITLNAMTPGSLTLEFIASDPGDSGLYLIEDGDSIRNTFSEGYWSFTAANSLTSTNYDLDLTGNGFTSHTIYGSTRILKRSNSSNPWTLNGDHLDATGSTAKRTTLSDISDYEFCFGDTTTCAGPVTSVVTGADSVCTGQTLVAYSVTNNPGNTYAWTIIGGAQSGGGTTNDITVDWGATPFIGNVSVVESDNCGDGAPVNRAITIHTLTIDSVDGRVAVGEATNDVVYEITNPQPGYTYTWSMLNGNGSIDFGQGSDSITVDWVGPGDDTLQVVASTGCSSTDTFKLAVIIYFSIHSVQTGDWTDPNTWDCSCIPLITDNVIIDSPHIVTLTGDIAANNFTISTGATFDNGTFVLSLEGEYDYIVNGTHAGSDSTILGGAVTYIGGTGSITNSGILYFESGNKTVTSPTDLTILSSQVVINTGLTVTNSGKIAIQNDLIGTAASSAWTNAANSTLSVGGDFLLTGTLNASASLNTINYNGTGAQTIKCPNSGQYHNLTISGSGTKTLACNTDVNGDLTISSTLDVDAGNDYSINIAGNWNNTGTFNEQNGTVTIDGSGAQSLINGSGETYNNLTINKSAGLFTLSNNVTVASTLTMTAGNTDASSGTLTLGTGTGNVGTLSRTSGTIIGNFERWINTTADPAPPVLYPVGTSGNYRPANVTFLNTLPTNGRLTGSFAATAPGNSGLPIVDSAFTMDNAFTEGYWALSPTGLSSTDYNLELTGSGFTSFTITSDTRMLKRASGGPWATTGWGSHAAAVPASSIAKRNNLDGFGEFAFGDTATCAGPPTSAIMGSDSVCTDLLGAPYFVTDHPPNTYVWVIIGGTKASGGSSSSITVDWGSTAREDAIVRVIEIDACTSGVPVDLTVAIHTLPTSVITGNTSIRTNTTNVPYTVVGRPGYTYAWSIVSGLGAIAFDDGGDSITVNWGATAGNDTVRVVGSMGCGSAATVDLPVNVFAIITSASSGAWTNTATWNCGCVPPNNGNAVIQNIHTVNLTRSDTIRNLTIDGGLLDNDFVLNITGDFVLDGNYAGSGELNLDGVNTTISGTGNMNNTGIVRIRNGDKTILAGTDITKAQGGSFTILSDIAVYSYADTMRIASDLIGGNASSTWVNEANATLEVFSAVLNTGTLTATSTDNTVNYYGDATQSIKETNYYNISVTGSGGRTTLSANLTTAGDINISDTLDVNNFDITVSGNWTNAGGVFIGGSRTVAFNGSGTQTITHVTGETFGSITIAGTSTLQTAGASDNINVAGDFTNNGSFNAQTGKITLNGAGAQSILGSSTTSFNDLELNKTGVASLGVAANLVRTLTLTSGTLNTGGQLTLVSNASGTANIAEITGGAISGDIAMQRYIAGDDYWRLMGSPVGGTSLGSWNDDFAMSGFPGSNAPSFPFLSMASYDEKVLGVKENGYVTPGGIGDGLGLGQGWFAYVGQQLGAGITLLTDLVGPANTGNVPIATTYTTSGGVDEDGWNLISNPYPSDIDWDVGITRSNVTSFAYLWDPNGMSYVPYDITDGKTIPSTQAFWVKNSSSGAGSVIFHESDKAADGKNFFKTYTIPGITLILTGNGFVDSTRIRLTDNATSDYDIELDAYKLYSMDPTKANIATLSTDSVPKELSINSMPKLDGDVTIPVQIGFSANGPNVAYTITANLGATPQGACILLEDVVTGAFTDLLGNNSYSFTQVGLTNLPARFLLHISAPLESSVTDVSCNGIDDGQVVATIGGDSLTYTWYNANQDTIQVTNMTNGPDTLSGLSPGNYTVIVNAPGSICPVQTDSFTIIEPSTISTSSTSVTPLCYGGDDGIIDLSVSGGTPPFEYLWSDSSITEDVSNLYAGNYDVTVTDNNQCTVRDSFNLTSPLPLAYQLTLVNESCDGQDNGSLYLYASGGLSPYEYIWSNGGTDSEINGLTPGVYAVTITDGNGCTADSSGIEIQSGLVIMAGYTIPSSTVNLNQGGGLQFTNISIGATNYSWDFGTGDTSILANPLYTFTTPGEHDVKLTAKNGSCMSTSSSLIVVISGVGISDDPASGKEFEISQAAGLVNVKFDLTNRTNAQITVHNILGQVVFDYTNLSVYKDNISLNLEGIAQGVYTVQITTGEQQFARKITIN